MREGGAFIVRCRRRRCRLLRRRRFPLQRLRCLLNGPSTAAPPLNCAPLILNDEEEREKEEGEEMRQNNSLRKHIIIADETFGRTDLGQSFGRTVG